MGLSIGMEPDRSAHWTYWIEFFVIPSLSLLLAGYAIATLPLYVGVSLFLLGCVSWTLLEYWIHRVALHHWPYYSDLHDVHHQHPKSYIGVSTIYVLAAFVVVGFCLALISSIAISAAILAGLKAAYGQYIFLHHTLHHSNKDEFGPYLKSLWDHHAAHHRGGDWNFGVSTIYWDKVFGTLRD